MASTEAPAASSWHAACAALDRTAYDACLAASSGYKQLFFGCVANLTQPLNLMRTRHSKRGSLVSPARSTLLSPCSHPV